MLPSVNLSESINFESLTLEPKRVRSSPASQFKQEQILLSQIKEPDIYGVFRNSEEYLNTVNLYLNCTDETFNRGLFFLKYVIEKSCKINEFLDIGPGYGLLTNWIGHYTNNITILDPSSFVLKKFKLRGFRNQKVEKIQNKVEIYIPKKKYDLICLCHVLYHIPQNKWLDVIETLFNHLALGGKLIIALNCGGSRDKIISKFGGFYRMNFSQSFLVIAH